MRPPLTLDRRSPSIAARAVPPSRPPRARICRRKGCSLLARNALSKVGELDLVLRDGATVVFVEVRYRAHAGYGGGAASVDAAKRRKLVRAAQVFLQRQPALAHFPCRFDVVDASGDPEAPDLRWIRAAFTATGR